MLAIAEKDTLLTLCRKAHITSEQLAREAGLPVYQIYTVEIGGYCQERIVKQVVDAYNKLSRQQHTIDEIQWKRANQWDALFSQGRGGRR
jgi:hypothetical protein